MHYGKDTTDKTLQTAVLFSTNALLSPWRLYYVKRVRGLNNVVRNVKTDPTLLPYASAITEKKEMLEVAG